MKDTLIKLIMESGSLTTEDIFYRILSAVIVSLIIYVSYWVTHAGTTYSRKFNVSLIALTILTATVMTVIANNLALSLGMVGALSIVRYRTAIKDSRDTVYIFWSIIVGICCGAGDYTVGAIGSGVVFIVLLILGRFRNDNRILLVIRGSRSHELELESVVNQYFKGKAVMKVKNTTATTIEMIFEMNKKVYQKMYEQDKSITDRLYEIAGTEYVNVVTQSDEVTG
jgi:hypothetical protein